MFDLKTIVTSVLVTSLMLLGFMTIGLVGDNQPVGGDTRFPNSDLSAATITSTGAMSVGSTLDITGDVTFNADLNSGIATTSTTTIAVGKVCYSFTTVNGTALYGWYTSSGVFATSTASCS